MISWRTAASLIAVLLVIVVVSLSPDSLRWLRTELPLANVGLGWLEVHSVAVNAVHVLLFFLVGMVLACALLPGTALWRVALAGLTLLAGVAVASEALQWLIPGRTSRLADVRDDLVGGIPGLILGLCLRSLWRWLFGVGVTPAGKLNDRT